MPDGAVPLAGGPLWFTEADRLSRDAASEPVAAADLPATVRDQLSAPRGDICGLTARPGLLIGIVNVTPDSFSDGGLHDAEGAGAAHGRKLADEGADILDIGGESTRPGATPVPRDEEIARVRPVIADLADALPDMPLSIDTRHAAVAAAAFDAGATLFNDVTALRHDPEALALAADRAGMVCLMHSAADPQTMQDDPRYGHVLLDVYDHLAERVAVAEAAGIPRSRILVDPGIGFGKTLDHNLALLRGLSLFHGLGCAVLLGASRKRFIGTLTGVDAAPARVPGSVAVAYEALSQGVQVLRVHDIAQTRQAVQIWRALHEREGQEQA
ncbi:dihydropteroate synthase [Rhodobacteraceae bacterium KN286]|uniref:Dihydropteroate synthase n=2 Tax=Oceanomicrobium pacificus TaxID=2692916 RepID=A0A6B0U3J0_9RHOB|nr:dihydropteroate synthase [Oceanomicrobium pacificus]